MAASSLNAVRVRLHFDYPPPCMPDCRMSWLLVDLNKCRVVADLCSVIREKFDYSRKTALDLFIENCFLPPAESIYVVRDNDSIRVKVSSVPCEYAGKKRRREEEGSLHAPTKKTKDEAGEANGVTPPAGAKKKKHKSKKNKRDESGDAYKADAAAKEPSLAKSQADKSGKKASSAPVLTNGKQISSDRSEEVAQKPSKSKHAPVSVSKRSRKPPSSESSSSEEENACVKKSPKSTTSAKTCPGTKKPKAQTSSVPKSTSKKMQTSSDPSSSEDEPSGAAAKKAIPPPKSSSGKQKSGTVTSNAQPSSSSSSEEEEDDDDSRKTSKTSSGQSSSKSVALPQARPPSSSRQRDEGKIPASAKPSGNSKISKPQTSSDSSSSEDETGKPNVPVTPKPAGENEASRTPSTPVGTTIPDNKDKAENSDSGSSSDTELVIKKPNPQLMIGLTPRGRGRGFTDRVKARGGFRGGFGRARGTPWKQNFHYNYDTEEQRKQKDLQTNRSLLLQNPPEPSPRRDYSALPLLAAPPAVGQKIVFKLLELNENYSPEVSDYKEAKIVGFNHSTNTVELELLTRNHARAEPGKFDLVYQNPDGSESVEYAVTVGSQLTERWESLLEPRLIVQNTD